MARIRACKPDEGLDEDLQRLSWPARFAWHLLWCHADKAGRMEDRPKKIKAQIMPYDDGVDFDRLLEEYVRGGFIYRYQVEGKGYIQIRSFEKHQRPHHTEPESTIPQMQGCNIPSDPSDNGETTVVQPSGHGEAQDLNGLGNGKGNRKVERAALALEFAERFWPAYPRHDAKADAEKAFVKARGKVELEPMLAALERQKRGWTETKFIPYPATWLNGERWLDDVAAGDARANRTPAETYELRKESYYAANCAYWDDRWGERPPAPQAEVAA